MGRGQEMGVGNVGGRADLSTLRSSLAREDGLISLAARQCRPTDWFGRFAAIQGFCLPASGYWLLNTGYSFWRFLRHARIN